MFNIHIISFRPNYGLKFAMTELDNGSYMLQAEWIFRNMGRLCTVSRWMSTLTCGGGRSSLEELTDVEVTAALAFLPPVPFLLLFLPSMATLSTGGGGKGLGAVTLDYNKTYRTIK